MKYSPLHFDPHALNTMIGGLSFLDLPHFSIQSKEEAKGFLLAYGFDLDRSEDSNRLWAYHRKAVTYIQEDLLEPNEVIPITLTDPNELKDISHLLVIASTRASDLQKWACAIFKVMHTFVHLENDLFSQFSNEIQDQIVKPIQAHVNEDSVIGTTLGPSMGPKSIVLKKFELKTFKTTTSSITKLLAKSDLVAFGLLDRIGVRIVTRHLFDVFRVLKYFLENNIVSFPHNISSQSNNTLYPLNLFIETIESLAHGQEYSNEEMDKLLLKRLHESGERAVFQLKPNVFSSHDYKFVKFITRKLVRVQAGQNDKPQMLSFFYPYEVQVVDYETHLKNVSGAASHELYKKRQVQKARERLIGSAKEQ